MACSTIIDSQMSLEAALAGSLAPPQILDQMCLIEVAYTAFDGRQHQGQLVIHRRLKEEVQAVFWLIEDIGFPVARVLPIVAYGWSDDVSMADNNTSAFNYRYVSGTERLSLHADGCAVDINPTNNPVFYENGSSAPRGALYDPDKPGTLYEGHTIVRAFLEQGWRWGGHFVHVRDYHHFEKDLQGPR